MFDRLFFWTVYVASAAATGMVAAAVSGSPWNTGSAVPGDGQNAWLDPVCLIEPESSVFVVTDMPFCVRAPVAPTNEASKDSTRPVIDD
jgi:hypothetical protein